MSKDITTKISRSQFNSILLDAKDKISKHRPRIEERDPNDLILSGMGPLSIPGSWRRRSKSISLDEEEDLNHVQVFWAGTTQFGY